VARRQFWQRINALAMQGVTVLVTTHFMEEAQYCDRMAIMIDGRLAAVDTPENIRRMAQSPENPEPTIEDAFIQLVDNPNPDTMTLCGHFERSKYLRPVYFADMRRAQQAMLRRQVSAILRLRDDFSRENLQRRGTIQLIVNGTDANTARIVTGYVRGVYARPASSPATCGECTPDGWPTCSSAAGRFRLRRSRCNSESGTTRTCAAATIWCPGWWPSS